MVGSVAKSVKDTTLIACAGLSMGMGFPWKSMGYVPWDGLGRDSTHCIFHGTNGTEIDEMEIENLLNERSDSEYECWNDN